MLIRRAVVATLEYEDFEGDAEVSLTFTDNEGIRVLNAEHRDIDRPTDVLSFPLHDPDCEEWDSQLGDVVISLERAAEQAEEFGHGFSREVAFLTVHSMLHLLGYDHVNSEAEDAEMRRRQREILEGMGLRVK
jgi:probable rRNA maturation factor